MGTKPNLNPASPICKFFIFSPRLCSHFSFSSCSPLLVSRSPTPVGILVTPLPKPNVQLRSILFDRLTEIQLNSNDFDYRMFHCIRRETKVVKTKQGAKKVIFTACHSGKLKLAFTSPNVILTSPKNVLKSRNEFTVLL